MRGPAIAVITTGLALGAATAAQALPFTFPVQADASVHAHSPDTTSERTRFGAGWRQVGANSASWFGST